jgi:hypothetical protein
MMLLENAVAFPVIAILGGMAVLAIGEKLKWVSAAEAQALMGAVEKPKTDAARNAMVRIFEGLAAGTFVDKTGAVRTFKLEEGAEPRFRLVIDELKALRY